MSKAIAVKKTELKQYDISKPAQMVEMANVLKNYIVGQGLYTEIQGKNYAEVDGWQFAGFLSNMNAIVEETINLSTPIEIKWKAVTRIYLNDKVISRGEALCSSKESKKKSFDEYAILSMAQTRSIGKAYRNKIGWIMKLAGYQSTPSEEMVKNGEVVKSTVVPSENVSQETPKKPGQKKGPDGEWTYVCEKDEDPISEAVAEFSMKKVGKRLCREHLIELSGKNKK